MVDTHALYFKITSKFTDLEDARIPVSVKEFPTYVKSMHKNTDHLFSEEYEVCISHDHHMTIT